MTHKAPDGTEHPFEVTNASKPMFEQVAVTKGDVVEYYERIAELMVPHVADRPLVLQRFPDGVSAGGFFQKNNTGTRSGVGGPRPPDRRGRAHDRLRGHR